MKLNRKEIIVNELCTNLVLDYYGYNTLAFLADIPKSALVTSVLVDGKHLKSAFNPSAEVTVEYPRDEYYEGKRVVAVLHSVYDGNKLVDAARSFALGCFTVEYVETAIAEV